MSEYLDLRTIRDINASHQRAVRDIRAGHPGERMLQDILIKQVRQAELNVLVALEVLMGKYAHAHSSAIIELPMDELNEMLAQSNIETPDNG